MRVGIPNAQDDTTCFLFIGPSNHRRYERVADAVTPRRRSHPHGDEFNSPFSVGRSCAPCAKKSCHRFMSFIASHTRGITSNATKQHTLPRKAQHKRTRFASKLLAAMTWQVEG